ncbi:eukaryotic aspartyl protease [Colletotrichum paranaense]|uniref:Eukaryotic aspartyl protease n=1 Tax=Colletotrichum paranaense TaxID=1914294 RepID=A0ABQ9S7Y7_9PEZI|nr:eukaryotic aspartyl protease [Colletotrichum paranaense]KAK1528308.1 eukaryotic aspartyl protease [Colletotrichum paranaense]
MKVANVLSSLLGVGLLSADAVLAKDRRRVGVEIKSPLKGVNFQRIKAFREAAPDEVSGRTQKLKPFHGRITGHNAATALGAAQPRDLSSSYQNITALSPWGTQYAVEVTWDGKLINMIFDTGSSDTWATSSNLTCTTLSGTAVYSPESCGFGPDKINDFKYGPVEDVHFALSYGSGERVSGPMGYSDIEVAGIVVKQQQVGLANKTYWMGNNYTNGVLGLAYPSITSAFTGDMNEDRPAFQVPYSPFFTSMVQQGLSSDAFSVSLVRNSSGVIGWGGRTGLPITGPTAYTDLIITSINSQRPDGSWQYSYYTILVDGLRWGSTSDTKKYLYIVDTGTTLMYVPPPTAEAIARSFSPSAIYLFQYGGYFAPCDAIAPKIAVIVEGASFFINPVDLIYRGLVDPLTGYCQIGITTGGKGPYILGSVFLHNVEAYFDVGAGQVRFYGRETYGATPELPEK